MKKLLNGIVDFRKNVRPTVKDTFALLALGQRPDTLFIACSDSRVVPNLFASTEPGDLFVIRNVGNLIPPYDADSTAHGSEAAAIQFGLSNLPITEIIVCGHSECGAIGALADERGRPADAPAFNCWLRHCAGSLRELEAGASLGNHLDRHNQLSQLNVLEQLEHLKTYPVVRERLASGQLRLHGWYFDIKEANVYEYEPSEGRFHLIDETYATTLLNRDRKPPEPGTGAPASQNPMKTASKPPKAEKKRCRWVPVDDPDYVSYHDKEWGRPVHDDRLLFEMLILEGAQAGLSWSTILHKRAHYQRAFAHFDAKQVARFDAARKAGLLQDPGIVRNRLKIDSTVTNAQAFLEVQREFGSFDRYLWAFVSRRPLINGPTAARGVPARTELSDRISKDLKKRGFRFVGTTIIYAYLQAVGVVNDHSRDCFLYRPPKTGRATAQ